MLPDINPNEEFDISDCVRADNSDKTFTAMQVKVSSKDMESCYYNLDFYFVSILNKGSDQGEEVCFLTYASMIRVKPKK